MGTLIVLILLGFGTILGFLALWKIYHVVKASIRKDELSISEDDFDRLAQAFIQHREEINSRVQNIETIITDGDSLHKIEEPDSQNRNTLHNDLNNKKRMQQ